MRICFLPVPLLFVCALCARAGDVEDARRILDLAGIRVGLCVHVGCGSEALPGLTAALAEGGGSLVHGLALDDAALARARAAIVARGVAGRAMAERFDGAELPYVQNLANIVVVEDPDALNKRGISRDALLKVLAPNGVLCVREDGSWTKIVKPRPAEFDEWTHPHRGADGNLASTDKALKMPLGLRWIDGLPASARTGVSGSHGWIVAGGRCVALTLNVTDNLGVKEDAATLFLLARDAFNGLPLWKVDTRVRSGAWTIFWNNQGPLAADERHVYSAQRDEAAAGAKFEDAAPSCVIKVDAVDGRIVAQWPTEYVPSKLLVESGIVVAACWKEKTMPKFSPWLPKGDAGAIEAFDTATDKPAWKLPHTVFQMLASHGSLYLLVQSGEELNVKTIVCVDIKSGAERWRVKCAELGTENDIALNVAGDGYVVVWKAKDKLMFVLGAADGRVLFKPPSSREFTPVIDGALWAGKKMNPLTGAVLGDLPGWFSDHHCSSVKFVGPYFIRNNALKEFPAVKGAKPVEFNLSYLRWSCIEGLVPANGMLYTSQSNCLCVPGALAGFIAVGSCGELPSEEVFSRPRELVKGPAFGHFNADNKEETGDWPCFRHDAARTGASPALLPEKLALKWKQPLAKPPDGPLAEAWSSQLRSCLTAPTVANGKVFAASLHSGEVFALETGSGATVWSALLGGRVDTPPTIHGGLCYVGCRDGWLYALREGDGVLAWRVRVAPWERRIVANGSVESIWPAIGSVIVRDNIVYACAGRTAEADGGVSVIAVDAATGATLWARAIGPGGLRRNDFLTWQDGLVFWNYLGMDPKTGKTVSPETMPSPKEFGGGHGVLPGPRIDGSWTRIPERRSGKGFRLGKTIANLMVWNDQMLFTPIGGVTRENDAPAWTLKPPRDTKTEAMAASASMVLMAGGERADAARRFFLRGLAAADGKPVFDLTLDARPTYDGLAVAQGDIFVSLQDGTLACYSKAAE